MQETAQIKIQELVDSILEGSDFFLVEMKVKKSRSSRISIFIDGNERNINLDECAKISKELSFLIDAHEIFTGSYRINISSPGLDRPLVDGRQYLKNRGRTVSVVYKNEEKQITCEGRLKDVLDDRIIIEKQDEEIELSYDKIVETKVVPSLK